MTSPCNWLWPSNDEINDFPDPLGFEAEWKPWSGTMVDEEMSSLAEIFARELIQNSWDSIQEHTKGLDPATTAGEGVEFRFVRLDGDAAADFVQRFGLHEHAARFAALSDKHRQDSRLSDSDVANGNHASIELLIASESWAEGMWGPWKTGGKAGVVSRLKSALMQTKSEKPHVASGGSWGHGKKGIANASKCRTLAVYSCSQPQEADHDPHGVAVTRRLLGVSYWRSHDLGDYAHVGIGLLGTRPAPDTYMAFLPMENEMADDFVESLALPGLQLRDHSRPGQTGVTYVIVEPSFSVDQLAHAVQRNWWPLLCKTPEAIRVLDHDGEEVDCSPDALPELAPFTRAYNIATEVVAPEPKTERFARVVNSAHGAVGSLGLTSDPTEDGWSYQDPESNATLVALVRNDMVVAYQPFPLKRRGKPPFVRGTFVVDREANSAASEALKMAEPHLHNEWITISSPSVPRDYANFAKWTLERVSTAVNELKGAIRAEAPVIDHQFREFSRMFEAGKSVTGGTGPKPPRVSRDFSIQYDYEHLDPNFVDPTLIRMRCRVRIALMAKVAKLKPSLEAEVDLGWGVLEERGPVRDATLSVPSSVIAPPGFTLSGGKYVGDVTSTPVEFEWESGFFPDDWQVVPDPRVQRSNQPSEYAGTTAGETE